MKKMAPAASKGEPAAGKSTAKSEIKSHHRSAHRNESPGFKEFTDL
jgi:hypothetical protein